MTTKAPEDEVCQSVLDFVAEGAYPESEKVVASDLPVSALSKELVLISKAREQVEAEISTLSRENDFDADGWISQAKQLHEDIERSRHTAREIVSMHESTRPLELKVVDAAAKVNLIQTEITFNEAVTITLEEVERLCQQLEAGRASLHEGGIMEAIDILEETKVDINAESLFADANVKNILWENVAGLRQEIADFLLARWNDLLSIDREQHKLLIAGDGYRVMLEETIGALSRLDMLDTVNDKLQKNLLSAIINPILLPSVPLQSRAVRFNASGITVETESTTATVSEVLDRIAQVLSYLQQSLPTSILTPFSDYFVPNLSSRIISSWLSSAIPTELSGLGEFESTLDSVLKFTKSIETLGWHGHEELVSWVNQAPRLWLTTRRVDSLDQIRRVLTAARGATKKVERVEKQQVSQADEALLENGPSDDWDAGWDDDNEEETNGKPASQPEDEEDVSAWGLDDDKDDASETKADAAAPETDDEDDAGDAWGWGDEEDEAPQEKPLQPPAAAAAKPTNGHDSSGQGASREVTLRETYMVTDIPDSIVDVVLQQITDSQTISQPAHHNSRVVSSGAALLALPTLILAMFKATASSFYGFKLNAGQMYLYNDSMYLAERIRKIVEEHQLSRLATDIDALEKFGKAAYSKEMQTQRTIVTDLLDGTQGFGQCSEQPFLGECENAISATVDRIRDVYLEWRPILSHSALLQSIGSLVSTVINKIIIDIEDLGDISEPQSQRLVSFCNQVSQLEDMFIPETTDGAEAVPMTAVYVRNWLRFQYLINILESSLADIKFLWLEGELRLEFSPDEVVDLIKALFAESDHRRKAIAEIRQNS
ncbi:uncharacterized protein EURHEDRAFT_412757 [Aspergillus ruber CBS 135680]|uniref:Retrograde transport protein Dsl1 C-terminal domain-containing protein n=1 Tax=Aspergillus ruber (strain CBS 135680) TaxID=1388766 RepID=A0A017SCZ8_ASPRC|nr:uncharacterized protein EURHEDRAFT_412757 [Aspergillus ruber CBS 135680]EYE94913.1 hypothetical protein EURHEDRAFT_412757 [Aspergillus ruber CBS 135680]